MIKTEKLKSQIQEFIQCRDPKGDNEGLIEEALINVQFHLEEGGEFRITDDADGLLDTIKYPESLIGLSQAEISEILNEIDISKLLNLSVKE